jgi:hypothetical protein
MSPAGLAAKKWAFLSDLKGTTKWYAMTSPHIMQMIPQSVRVIPVIILALLRLKLDSKAIASSRAGFVGFQIV